MPRPDFTSCASSIPEIIRVNHAGEYGAQRIYRGQLKFTRDAHNCSIIKEMLKQEEVHLSYFTKKLVERRIRPTLLMPLWHIAGYALGAASALLGNKTAMIVTKSVEEVIEQHYQKQIDYLQDFPKEKALLDNIKQFQLDEIEHKDIAVEHESDKAMLANLTSKVIKLICNLAISLSKKI